MSRILIFVFYSGLLAACSNDSKAKSQAAQQASPVPPAGSQAKPSALPAASAEKVKRVEGHDPGQERFKLTIQTPEAKAGVLDSVHIEVTPQSPWHINLDFPTSLQIDPPEGVIVAKAAQKKSDALRLDAEGAAFKIEFTAQNPGEKSFTGEFKFAVCQDEACAPVTERVEFKVAVK